MVAATYTIGSSISPLIMGPLSDTWGRRPVYIFILLVYVAASSGAAISKQIWHLSIMIILQGFADSSTLPLCDGVLSDIALPAERGKYVLLFTIGRMIIPLTGPVIGGIITHTVGWRWVFVLLAAMGSVCLIFIGVFIPETLRI
ncbi:major facilitator superfamily domain-containing protein, partial [Syncephalastrum racemosum]